MNDITQSATSQKSAAEKLAAKRATVLEAKPSKLRHGRLILVALILLALAGGGAYTLIPAKKAPAPSTGKMFTFVPTEGGINYPLSKFEVGVPRFYQHRAEGKVLVRYFVVKLDDGAYAALDACASCWKSGQGHRVEDGELVCATCRKRFAVAELGSHSDACAPLALKTTVTGGNISVDIAGLNGGAKYFKTLKKEK